jgi:hypothetical protein
MHRSAIYGSQLTNQIDRATTPRSSVADDLTSQRKQPETSTPFQWRTTASHGVRSRLSTVMSQQCVESQPRALQFRLSTGPVVQYVDQRPQQSGRRLVEVLTGGVLGQPHQQAAHIGGARIGTAAAAQ